MADDSSAGGSDTTDEGLMAGVKTATIKLLSRFRASKCQRQRDANELGCTTSTHLL